MNTPSEEEHRRKAIAWATTLTRNTPLEPQAYERRLLELYARGELTLERVVVLLDEQVHHILYCSEVVQALREDQLTDLLEQSHRYNEQHQITGLLCYSGGHFVQLLEGPKEAVYALYARIRQDTRHRHVVALRDGAGPTRWFADWRMALVEPTPREMYWIITHLQTRQYNLVSPRLPITDPRLLTLLGAFSQL